MQISVLYFTTTVLVGIVTIIAIIMQCCIAKVGKSQSNFSLSLYIGGKKKRRGKKQLSGFLEKEEAHSVSLSLSLPPLKREADQEKK